MGSAIVIVNKCSVYALMYCAIGCVSIAGVDTMTSSDVFRDIYVLCAVLFLSFYNGLPQKLNRRLLFFLAQV